MAPFLLLLLAAPPSRLAVLPVLVAPSADANASKVFSAIGEAASLRQQLRVMSIDDYFFHEGGQLADRALACGADTRCIAKQLAPFEADLGLVVIINPALSPPLLSLILLDTKTGDVVDETYLQVPGDTAVLFERLQSETSAMLDRRGFDRAGRLFVRVDPARAKLSIRGATADIGQPNQFTLPAGTYELTAEADDYDSRTAQVTVVAGTTTQVPLSLEPNAPLYTSPWLWTVGAVVVVGAVVGVGFATLSSRTDCICVRTVDEPSCGICQ